MSSICVFCGSNSGKNQIYSKLAKDVGEIIAERNDTLVYGGGSIGLMGTVADSCLNIGGQVIGIIPEYLNKLEVGHKNLTRLLIVKDMFERKSKMEKLSDGFFILPGGVGTLDELFEMITLAQLKQHIKPVIIFNINKFYDPLIQQIQNCIKEGFIHKEHLDLFIVADSASKAFQKFDSFNNKLN